MHVRAHKIDHVIMCWAKIEPNSGWQSSRHLSAFEYGFGAMVKRSSMHIFGADRD